MMENNGYQEEEKIGMNGNQGGSNGYGRWVMGLMGADEDEC